MLAFRPTPLEFLTIFENVHIIGHGVGTKFQGIKQCEKVTTKNTNCGIHSKTAYNSTENEC